MVARTDGGMTKRERHATFEKYFLFISKHKHTNGFVCVDGSTFSLLVFWIRSNQLYGQSKHGIPIRPFINVARLIPSPHCHCYTSMNAKGFLPIRSRRHSSLSKYWCQIKYSFVRKASIAFMVIINQHRNHIQSKAREAKKKIRKKGRPGRPIAMIFHFSLLTPARTKKLFRIFNLFMPWIAGKLFDNWLL